MFGGYHNAPRPESYAEMKGRNRADWILWGLLGIALFIIGWIGYGTRWFAITAQDIWMHVSQTVAFWIHPHTNLTRSLRNIGITKTSVNVGSSNYGVTTAPVHWPHPAVLPAAPFSLWWVALALAIAFVCGIGVLLWRKPWLSSIRSSQEGF